MGNGISNDGNDFCTECREKFNIVTRKKRVCKECNLFICKNCTGSRSEMPQQLPICRTCTVLLSTDISYDVVMQLHVKKLRRFLQRRNIPDLNTCSEKHEFVDLVLQHFGGESYRAAQEDRVRHIASLMAQSENSEDAPETQRSESNDQLQHSEETLPSQTQTASNQTTNMMHGETNAQHSHAEEVPNSLPSETLQTTNQVLADIIESFFGEYVQHPDTVESPQTHQAQNQVYPGDPVGNPELTTNEPHAQAPVPGEVPLPPQNQQQETDSISKFSLTDVQCNEDIDSLTVKQLKRVLATNLVDYRGCREKHELVSRVRLLWESQQANKKLYERLLNPPESTGPGAVEEPELCKICMDSAIDCVLLECGHMVTCTKCGKQMNECPICRQYVIRAVHIFRA